MGTLFWSPVITGGICFLSVTAEICFGDDYYYCGVFFLSHLKQLIYLFIFFIV